MSSYLQLKKWVEEFNQGSDVSAIYSDLFGPQCLLLKAACERWSDGDFFAEQSFPNWVDFERGIKDILFSGVCKTVELEDEAAPLIVSPLTVRERLIRLSQSNDDPDRIAKKLGTLVKAHHALQGRADWSLKTLQLEDRFADAPLPQPAWRAALPNENWRKIFDSAAQDFGWFDPALALTATSLAAILPPATASATPQKAAALPNTATLPNTAAQSNTAALPNTARAEVGRLDMGHPAAVASSLASDFRTNRTSRSVSTSILLAVEQPAAHTGLVGELTLRTVPDGCGYLYPDHWSMGYLCSSNEGFQEALRNAWFRVMRHKFGTPDCDFDLVWSLKLLRNGNPILPSVRGRSAELAMAAALRAIRDDETLDPWSAVTGKFANPLNLSDPFTAPVDGVDAKLSAQDFGDRFQRARISDLVIDHKQEPGNDKIRGPRPHRVDTFDEAYEHLSQWSVMTRTANQGIANAAEKKLIERCRTGKQPDYARSPLSRRRVQRARPPAGEAGRITENETDPWVRLTQDERERLVRGDGKESRLHLIADSGLGKTTLLIHCEHQIAAAQSGLLPIRFEHLALVPWEDDDQFYNELAQRYRDHVPAHRENIALIKQWLQRLRDKGRLVFLLDAIDQTSLQQQEKIRHWLDRSTQDCRVYVTGRPSTQSLPIFDSTSNWTTLRVDLLDPDQVTAFLSLEQQQALRQLFPGEDPLLRVPMLLALLHDLANSEQLAHFANRERIYQAALEGRTPHSEQRGGLIDRGLQSLKKSPYNAVLKSSLEPLQITQTVSLLGLIAWEMVFQNNLQGRFESTELEQLNNKLKRRAGDDWERDILPALEQIGLFRTESHSQTLFLEWRHLSFCEYFAGVHLAEAISANDQTQILSQVLDNLQARRTARTLTSDQQPTGNSPHEQWRWIFRFALSRAAARNRTGLDTLTLNHLASQLIAHGQPYVVFESMVEDGIESCLNPAIAQLTRWLVHQTWDRRDWRSAWPADQSFSPTLEQLQLLRTFFDRRYRHGPALPPAWQLVSRLLPQNNQQPLTDLQKEAVAIRNLFFHDCGDQLQATSGRSFTNRSAVVRSQLVRSVTNQPASNQPASNQPASDQPASDRSLIDESVLTHEEQTGLREFLDQFVPCPPVDFDLTDKADQIQFRPPGDRGPSAARTRTYLFRMGAAPHDRHANADELPQHWVEIRSFEMADFCVTNALFECMDPSHFWYRDANSRRDDQPVLRVNWHMAQLYGIWLTGMGEAGMSRFSATYRLPTEEEWEFAARGGRGTIFWWGDTFSSDHCHHAIRAQGTLGRAETVAKGDAYRNAFKLFHMAGNHHQWCHTRYQADQYLLRSQAQELGNLTPVWNGGNSPYKPDSPSVNYTIRGGVESRGACRIAFRSRVDATRLLGQVGFRVCRVSS